MDGEENNPITIRSSDLNNNAVIDGQADPNFPTIGLYIVGNHWSVQDIIIQNANKGVIFDAAVGGELLNCVIRRSGKLSVRLRSETRLNENEIASNNSELQAKKLSTFAMVALIS